MDIEEAELRAALTSFPRQRNTDRYPKELRARVVAYASGRLKRGASSRSVARGLGMRHETLQRWLKVGGGPTSVVPVRVVNPPRTITLVAPNGWRIEGLTAAEAVAVVRGAS